MRIRVVVEGQTEEAFIKSVVAEYLQPQGVHLEPILLGKTGGHPTYARVRKDILLHLKQETRVYCTTLLDFYGLGAGFPGTPIPRGLSSSEKAQHIERAIVTDITQEIPFFRPDLRLLPYIQMHEFEGLLFSDPAALAEGIHRPDLEGSLREIREGFETPEEINDGRTQPRPNVCSRCTVRTAKYWMERRLLASSDSIKCSRHALISVTGLND